MWASIRNQRNARHRIASHSMLIAHFHSHRVQPAAAHSARRSTPGAPRSTRSNARHTPDALIPTRRAIARIDHPFSYSSTISRSRSEAPNRYSRSATNHPMLHHPTNLLLRTVKHVMHRQARPEPGRHPPPRHLIDTQQPPITGHHMARPMRADHHLPIIRPDTATIR